MVCPASQRTAEVCYLPTTVPEPHDHAIDVYAAVAGSLKPELGEGAALIHRQRVAAPAIEVELAERDP